MMPSSSILQKISIFGILYPQELFIRLKIVYDENKTNVTLAFWRKRDKSKEKIRQKFTKVTMNLHLHQEKRQDIKYS